MYDDLSPLVALRDRKRSRLEELSLEAATLKEEVETLDKAIAIARRDLPGEDSDVSSASGPSLIERIREIVADMVPPFSTGMVRDRLREVDPDLYAKVHRTSIAGTMRRMAEGKGRELIVVQAGGPGKEATYRLPTSQDEQPRSEERADEQQTVEGERDLVEAAR